MVEIKEVSTEELRRRIEEDALVIRGCGGDLSEWVDGITKELSEAGILKEGSPFANVESFKNDGETCLLFPLNDVDLDIGKLAMWRIGTHGAYGGTWLSDYIVNRLGGYISPEEEAPLREKPDCNLIGQDGNIFNLIGIASRTLKRNGMVDEAKEMSGRVFGSGSYEEALSIIGEYVNITGPEELDFEMGGI